MKVETVTSKSVESLIDWRKNQFLQVNYEYQRAPVWTPHQKQMFIDSIFRGYSVPAFYLHHERKESGELSSVTLSIIDGQQRINALYEYYEGAYPLLDPAEDSTFKFPNFVKGKDCPWAGKRFKDLDESLKQQFLRQPVVVYQIETNDGNEIRDLFIRLQGGTPLSPQEKRDSWPGNFTEYILNLGGKFGVNKYPGHDFFTKTAKPSGSESNRRKVAAQTAMLYFNKRETKSFCDIKSVSIDRFYHEKIDFDFASDEVKRFERILAILVRTFSGSKPLKAHYAIGMILLVDSLLDNYVPGWEANLRGAFDEFNKKCIASAKAMKQDNVTDEYYDMYVRWTSTSTDVMVTIQRRHYFFVEKMLQLIAPTPKDPQRGFTDMEREIIFYRDKRICQVCKMRGDLTEIPWDDAEVHHVNEHRNGGRTALANGALVHKSCHPRSQEAVEEFRLWWESKERDVVETERNFPPPESTECRFRHYRGRIEKGKLVVGDQVFNSFSRASCDLTGTSRNGWNDWEIKLPNQSHWILSGDWRNSQNIW